MKKIMYIILCLLIASTGYAEIEQRWHDEGELSFTDTSGNTETRALALKNKLTYDFSDILLGTWKANAVYGESDGDKNAENYATELRGDYTHTDKQFFYGVFGWSKDEFANIDQRFYFGPGTGYKFLTGPEQILTGEIGLNYVYEEFTVITPKGKDGRPYFELRAFGAYEYNISDKSKFTQTLEFLYDLYESENYRLVSESAFITSVNDYLSLKTSYTIKYDNEPGDNSIDETDTILALNLVVTY